MGVVVDADHPLGRLWRPAPLRQLGHEAAVSRAGRRPCAGTDGAGHRLLQHLLDVGVHAGLGAARPPAGVAVGGGEEGARIAAQGDAAQPGGDGRLATRHLHDRRHARRQGAHAERGGRRGRRPRAGARPAHRAGQHQHPRRALRRAVRELAAAARRLRVRGPHRHRVTVGAAAWRAASAPEAETRRERAAALATPRAAECR
mmetsp:Transcript_14301/g.35430  ORF Transcript_14301/g.35430 Transcript_14301/m.35430 type:complete len:202 (+) Transcript_14301:175-780(+)